MGDSDLVASTTRIARCAQALTRIHDEFAHHANPADGYGHTELGSDLLVHVFEDFGSNWKIHREQLTNELERLATITGEAAKTFAADRGPRLNRSTVFRTAGLTAGSTWGWGV